MRRSIKEADAVMQEQIEKFQEMLEKVKHQPSSKSILDNIFDSNKDDSRVDDLQLMKLQANSFAASISDVDLGEDHVY